LDVRSFYLKNILSSKDIVFCFRVLIFSKFLNYLLITVTKFKEKIHFHSKLTCNISLMYYSFHLLFFPKNNKRVKKENGTTVLVKKLYFIF